MIREPLSAALTASVRARPASRVSLVLRSAVVAVALAAVGNLLDSGDQSSQLLALLTPMLVALAVAVGGAVLLRLLAPAWMRRTASGGGTAAYLASRRLGRRQDVANLMVPLLLAAAVLTFAASTTATSDAWRVARAEAEVGAARSYVASASPGRLLQVTREVDPEGRYVAAAATNTVGDDMSRSVFVDTSRLGRVVAWDPSWSDRSLASLQQQLALDHGKRITFTGKELLVDRRRRVAALRAPTCGPACGSSTSTSRGEQKDLTGRRAPQRPASGARGPARGLRRGRASLEQIYVTGSSVSVSDVQGRLTILSVEIDHRLADWHLDPALVAAGPAVPGLAGGPAGRDRSRRAARPRARGSTSASCPPGEGPQNAQVSGFARITPATTPDTVPALVTRGTRTETAARTGSRDRARLPGVDGRGSLAQRPAGPDAGRRPGQHPAAGRHRGVAVGPRDGAGGVRAAGRRRWSPPSCWWPRARPASVVDAVRATGVGLTDPRSLDGDAGATCAATRSASACGCSSSSAWPPC